MFSYVLHSSPILSRLISFVVRKDIGLVLRMWLYIISELFFYIFVNTTILKISSSNDKLHI